MVDILLKGTHHHYLCYLPSHKGLFSSWLLKRFFSGIKDDAQQLQALKAIPEDATVVYLNKFQSYFEFLFYHTRHIENRLPVPELGFNYHVLILQPLSRLMRVLLARFDFLILKWKLTQSVSRRVFSGSVVPRKKRFSVSGGRKGFL